MLQCSRTEKEFQSSGGEEFGANLSNKCMLETIASTEMILAFLWPLLNDLETLYIPWYLSGMQGMGLNHSTYARYAGTCAAGEDVGDGNSCEIAIAGN